MTAATDLDETRRQVESMMRALRRMPAESRRFMDEEMLKTGDRIARRIDQEAGSVPYPGRVYATALRRGGIRVYPGRGELQIKIGGATRAGIGRLTMRQIVMGAEFGGGARRTRYTQRRKSGPVTVVRATTRQFGRHVTEGRFVHPTWLTEGPRALEDWSDAVAEMLERYWTDVMAHG